MNEIDYSLRKSRRARKMRITIYCDGSCVVTVPRGFNISRVEKFISEKSDWIKRKIEYFRKRKFSPILSRSSRGEYLKLKSQAYELVKDKIKYLGRFYDFSYNKIAIRNQKTRWGSCSRKRNLSFNYKIALLPRDLADYIIVHEVCHLQEFNHSLKFWKLVEIAVPNHKEIRKKLR